MVVVSAGPEIVYVVVAPPMWWTRSQCSSPKLSLNIFVSNLKFYEETGVHEGVKTLNE